MPTIFKKMQAGIISSVGAIFIFVFVTFLGTTNIAHAQVGAIACNSGAIFSAIGSALGIGGIGGGGGDNVPVADDQTESNTTASKNVQCTWNGIAWQLAQIALHALTGNVVNWINSGFQGGNPSFLTNPEGYFSNLSDQTAVNFLGNNGPLNNGSPFSNNIVSALALGQAYGNHAAYNYNLNAVIGGAPNTPSGSSAQGFLGGDFSQGGWSAFISLGQSNNNQSGEFLQAQSDLVQQISTKQNFLQQQLQQGNGFLSWQSCTAIPDGSDDTSQQTCTTETPGSVISSALNKQLGAPTDELNMTHDINEVVDALFSNLLSNTLNGGLLSASQPTASNNGQSLLNQLVNNDQQTQSNSTSLQGQVATQVQSSAASAVQAVAYRTQILTNITAERTLYQTTASCIANELAVASSTQNSQTTQPSTNYYQANNPVLTVSYLQNELNSINSAIAGINQIITKVQSDLQTASTSVATYQNMANQIKAAPSLAAANTLSNQLSAQIAATPYSGASDPKAAQADLTTINTTVKTLETSRTPYQTVCNGQMAR